MIMVLCADCQNINLIFAWYEPLQTPIKLKPQHFMDQLYMATNGLYNICRHFMHKF